MALGIVKTADFMAGEGLNSVIRPQALVGDFGDGRRYELLAV
jgi:hypothetical protein